MEQQLVWIGSSLLIIFYFIVILYWSMRFFMKRKEPLLAKRYAMITVYQAIFCVLQLVFVMVYQSMLGIRYILSTHSDIYTYHIIKYCAYFGHLVSMLFVFYLLICRFYLLRYDLKLIALLLKNEWKRIINPNYTNEAVQNDIDCIQLNWYYKNRNKPKYHSFKGISCRLILICLIPTAIIGPAPYCIMSLWYGEHYKTTVIFAIINLILFTIPCFILYYIYHTIPKIYDKIYVYDELTRIILVMLILYILTIGEICINIFIKNEDIKNLLISILLNIIYFDECLTIMIATCWVLKKTNHIVRLKSYEIKQLNGIKYISINSDSLATQTNHSLTYTYTDYTDSITNISYLSPLKGNINNYNNRLPALGQVKPDLFEVLADQKGISSFMEHISLEFELTKMLAFIEFIQLMKLIHEYEIYNKTTIYVTKKKRNENLYQVVEFAENVPSSQIVFNRYLDDDESFNDINQVSMVDMNTDEFLFNVKMSSYLLFVKYINFGAQHEINCNRKNIQEQLVSTFHNKQRWIQKHVTTKLMLNIFKEITDDLFMSIMQSFNRFIRTKEFEKLHNYYVSVQNLAAYMN